MPAKLSHQGLPSPMPMQSTTPLRSCFPMTYAQVQLPVSMAVVPKRQAVTPNKQTDLSSQAEGSSCPLPGSGQDWLPNWQ